MNNDWFFEKFALIADAPGAVAKMRGLVLDLAVRGKLVRQKQQDESATILLERIHSSSSQTPTRRSIRRQDTQADIEPPYPLPINWTWTTLGTIADWGSGSTPSRGNPEFFGGKITWLKSGELNDNRVLVGSEEQVTELAITKGSFRQNKPGDVLFAMYGATVGKAAILAEPALTNQAVCGCTPCLGVLNDYLFFYLVSQRQKFRNASEGGAQPNFSKDKIVTYPFPLPPLAEQKRIVAKVDELMGLCDALETQQQERELRKSVLVRASLSRFAEAPTPENLGYLFHKSYDIPPSELRKSILTLAVQGKLVPQDPNDRPAEESVLPQNKKATTSKNEQDVPFELPSAWQWTPLGKVSELINGDRSKSYPNKDEYVAQGVPWINTGHIEPAGTLSMELMHYITRKKFDSLRSGKVRPGDLVYCLRGATLGKTAIITQFDEGAVASSLVIIRLAVTVNPRFAYRFLTSPLGREQIFQFDNGSAQPNLSANNVKKYWMPLPPLAEQHRIVTKVDQLMALVDELERQQDASRENATKLLDAIVQEMTSGERDIAATLES
jgi:type I restriction enzyme S subunit